MNDFDPIAIVGMSCVLPGAMSPAELWRNVLSGEDLLGPPPAGLWRLSENAINEHLDGRRPDKIISMTGGYVRDFDRVFDPASFGQSGERLLELDPLFQWVVWGTREALQNANHDCAKSSSQAGLIIGNLGFPSATMTHFAESVWRGMPHPDPRNRFCFGGPSALAAEMLGLGLGGVSLDAACASSLYAIKLACDQLHDQRADLMVAGGVNGADDLFLHAGFTALGALSPTGRSLPFHRKADGLVSAQGAAFVVLKRLSDAVVAGDKIHAVIRGIGLGNDGRSAGLLSPSKDGQVRTMQAAYAISGLRPKDVSFVECHATGTPVGDAVEIRSMARVFSGCKSLPVGSLKSNLGHLVAAAGAAGLLKVVLAMQARTLPPMRNTDEPSDILRSSHFRTLAVPEPWECSGLRRAAVSSFGFGGNNSHLILEEWQGQSVSQGVVHKAPIQSQNAIVGIGVVVGEISGVDDFARAILQQRSVAAGQKPEAPIDRVDLPIEGVRFPPLDLERTLAQQLILLKAAQQALGQCGDLSGLRTGVFVGIEVDPEVARHGLAWRLEDLLREQGHSPSGEWLEQHVADVAAPLSPARVLGCMPNMPANRLNSQFDLAGPGFTIGAGEKSGTAALEIAQRALRTGELDVAVVCAVDLSCESVHKEAIAAVGVPQNHVPGDAAVVLVLRGQDDVKKNDASVFAVLDSDGSVKGPSFGAASSEFDLRNTLGESYTACGLLHLAAAALCCKTGCLPSSRSGELRPWLPENETLSATVAMARSGDVAMNAGASRPATSIPSGFLAAPAPELHCYSGASKKEVLKNLLAGAENSEGPRRLAFVATPANFAERIARAEQLLREVRDNQGIHLGHDIFYSPSPVAGEVAYVLTGAAAAYSGMGSDLLSAVPELSFRLHRRVNDLNGCGKWIYEPPHANYLPTPEQQLRGSSFLCQIHTELASGMLGIKPDAVLGLSSGETNTLFATGAWSDIDSMFAEITQLDLYDREIAGTFDVARRAWGQSADAKIDWRNYRVLAPIDQVSELLAHESRAHLLIIHAPNDCLIGGDANTCRRVLEKLGSPPHFEGEGLVAHCPEMAEYAETWRALHHRPTVPVPGIRFYANAAGASYVPTDSLTAEMLVGQALATVDFPRTVNKAWNDGARIFIELGPRGLCSEWISKTLADRSHVAVAFDRSGQNSLSAACNAIAALTACGIAHDSNEFFQQLQKASMCRDTAPTGRILSLPARPKVEALLGLRDEIRALSSAELAQLMAPAPELPCPVEDYSASALSFELEETLANAHDEEEVAIDSGILVLEAVGEAHRSATSAQVGAFRQSLQARLSLLGGILEPVQSRGVASQLFPTAATDVPVRGTPTQWDTPSTITAPAQTVPQTAEVPEAAPPDTHSRGRTFTRAELEVHAFGQISSIFGPQFRQQDGYVRQVRLPMDPLLFPDRVTGLVGEPGSMGLGTVWTETDVREDSWFVHEGRVPPGILVEAGQADLFLISWLGADLLNQDQRVYRMLGCELTYFGESPKVGDTLCYEIHVDGHATHGCTRLFFFSYDCTVAGKLCLRMRGGQAGFFTDEELQQPTGGLWDPNSQEILDSRPNIAPGVRPQSRFSREQIKMFADGRGYSCFGDGYQWLATHTASPGLPGGKLLLMDEITDLDPTGGPWKRGYMRAVTRLSPDDWFFPCHFKNDPVMPGTLMAETGFQALAFYMAAMGLTLERDGWRFEPVPERPISLQCRSQVIPTSREIVYEIFVHGIHDGPTPSICADVLGTVDGVKAFFGRGLAIQLVPDWPMERPARLAAAAIQDKQPALDVDGFKFDSTAMANASLGRPTKAFGALYRNFDGVTRVARLPGPPYSFVSRVVSVDGPPGQMRNTAEAVAEYDIPRDAWYFSENAAGVMPFCVLMEVALQPCGWLACFNGCVTTAPEEMFFRNLDGNAKVHAEITPASGKITTRTKLTSMSRSGGIILVSFDVTCSVGGHTVYEMKTGFGFFSKSDLANQVGLPGIDETFLRQDSDFLVDLTTRPKPYFDGPSALPGGMLLMLDRVSGYWKNGGAAGLGRLRAEKDVNPADWFFKAHFFQDPVQPGSLGVESMLQLLHFYMLHEKLDEGIMRPHFEPVAIEQSLVWKYRGQVLPTRNKVTVELEIKEITKSKESVVVIADAWLWVDGVCIYNARKLGGRIVAAKQETVKEFAIDPATDTWVLDHRPNFVIPTLPMMDIANRLAEVALAACPGQHVTALKEVRLADWVAVDGPRRFRTTAREHEGELIAELGVFRQKDDGGDFQTVARAVVETRADYPTPPQPLAALANSRECENPYNSGVLFHGPAFHVLKQYREGEAGATGTLDASVRSVPVGALHTALLDGAYHIIPNNDLHRWSSEIPADQLAFPYKLKSAQFFCETPVDGEVRCEARFDGFEGPRFPRFHIQMFVGEKLWADIVAVHVLIPKGPIGVANPKDRKRFLQEKDYVPGVALSRFEDGTTRLSLADVQTSDWLEGSVARIYQASGDLHNRAREIAIKEHVARKSATHPGLVRVAPDGGFATPASQPLTRYSVRSSESAGVVTVTDDGDPQLDLAKVRNFWTKTSQLDLSPVLEKFFFNLCRQFLQGVTVRRPQALEELRSRPVLFLGNHQVLLESCLFSALMPVISGASIVPLAKIEQKNSLLVTSVLATCRAFGGMPDTPIIYFDRSNPQSLFGIVDHIRGMMLREGSSALVHVEGIRSQTCRKPVQTVSGVILDLALSANVPIVPVRFVGGLPIETAPARLDFPIGFGKQTYMLGDPISPEVLAKLPLVDRKELVLSAINQLGPHHEEEIPAAPDPQFAAKVTERANSQAISETEAVLLECAELPYKARIADLIALTNLQGPSQPTAGEK